MPVLLVFLRGQAEPQLWSQPKTWPIDTYLNLCLKVLFKSLYDVGASPVSLARMRECVLSRFTCVQLCATLWTIARQASLSMGFSRQGYWSGLPCPPPGDLPNPGIKPTSLKSPALAGGVFTTGATWEASISLALIQFGI